MMKGATLDIDLAKNVLQFHGVNERGKVAVQKRVSRGKLLETVAQLPPCVIGMAACSGAQSSARECQRFGHTVRGLSAPNL